MTAFVDRIPGASALIAAFRGDVAAEGETPAEPKYGGRFLANTILLAVVGTLVSLWFAVHVKPHVSVVLFGSVSLAGLAAGVAGIFWTFVKKDDVTGSLRRLLRMPEFTRALLVLVPPIVFAYATTCTIFLTAAGDGAADVRLNVKHGTSSTPVAFSAAHKQRAVTYFFAFRSVTARIETLAPTGYKARELPLRRGIPTELTVPDRSSQKSFSLVRLMPLYNLFQLRGRSEPDQRYTVRVFLPGAQQPIERAGLTFGAIYLGASLPDLETQSKTLRGAVAELRNTLRGLDGEMKPDEIDEIVADWLDRPVFIATPELAPGDRIRVVLESPAGTSETTVKVAAPVNTAFLRASAQGE